MNGDLTAVFSGNSFKSIGIDHATNTITSANIKDSAIYRWGSGAGVVNSRFNQHTVDGYGKDDFVEISFDKAVSMKRVKFSYFDAYDTVQSCSWSWHSWMSCTSVIVDDDDFRWMYDLSGNGTLGVGDYISANQNANPFTDFGSVTSRVFGFGVFEWNDDWKLEKITVEYEEMAPVPLPASGIMLVAAVGAAAGFGARRKKYKPIHQKFEKPHANDMRLFSYAPAS